PLPRGEQQGSNGKGDRWGGVSPDLHGAQRRKIGDTPSDGVSALTRTLAGARAEPLAFFCFKSDVRSESKLAPPKNISRYEMLHCHSQNRIG
ncbi:hypothetical protein, partial [Acetobacter tropicalis]|uniref:hypothetical protein n=1 Tax=Acetobacter tropicalis TaxID=104102 RepID=UPI001EE674F7